jgi:hypothetical protein
MDSRIVPGILLFVLLYYAFVQICAFYGLDSTAYGIYVTFYLFLAACVMVLPTNYEELFPV